MTSRSLALEFFVVYLNIIERNSQLLESYYWSTTGELSADLCSCNN